MNRNLMGIILIAIIALVWAQQDTAYLPIAKGNEWQYKVADISDTSFDGTGKFKGVYSKNLNGIPYSKVIKVKRDTVVDGKRDVQFENYELTENGNIDYWMNLNHLLLSGDTVFQYYDAGGPDANIIRLFDILAGAPGATITKFIYAGMIDTLNDTVSMLKNTTITVPAGTYNCQVTELRGRYISTLLVDAWLKENIKIVNYKAKGIGIVRQVRLLNGIPNYLCDLDSVSLKPFSRIGFKRNKPEPQLRLAAKVQPNQPAFVYNIKGQKVASRWEPTLPNGVYLVCMADVSGKGNKVFQTIAKN